MLTSQARVYAFFYADFQWLVSPAGAAPLTLSTNATPGGSSVTLTATLEAPHSPYAIVNLEGTGPLVPPLCNPPLFLMANTNTAIFVEPTGVVTTPTTVPL